MIQEVIVSFITSDNNQRAITYSNNTRSRANLINAHPYIIINGYYYILLLQQCFGSYRIVSRPLNLEAGLVVRYTTPNVYHYYMVTGVQSSILLCLKVSSPSSVELTMTSWQPTRCHHPNRLILADQQNG